MENGAAFERQLQLLEGPIFHFHDYGRKGEENWPKISDLLNYCKLVKTPCIYPFAFFIASGGTEVTSSLSQAGDDANETSQ